MKCENCYHYEACKSCYRAANYTLGEDIKPVRCPLYKDKSLIVELPCRVGETIYALGCPSEPIESWTILYPSIAYEENGYIHHTPLSSVTHLIEKNIFLSYEEAERALEEYKK